jgi:steroid delta-isomerase-like uncharacterized protein
MTEAEQRDLIARYVAAYNRFDVDGMLALVTEDVRFENVSGGRVTASASGSAEFRTLAQGARSLFREREQRVTAIAFRDGGAVASIAYRGVLAADVLGGPAAGTVLEVAGESEFGFAGGRISRLTDRWASALRIMVEERDATQARALLERRDNSRRSTTRGDAMIRLDANSTFPTAEEYRKAFAAVRDQMTVNQLLLLQRHYYAPGRTTTARRLAAAVQFQDWRGVNLQYGGLSKKVCEALNVEIDCDALFVLATFVRDPGIDEGECQLVMRVQVARALELLGWVW